MTTSPDAPDPGATMQSEAMRRSGGDDPGATMQSEAMRRSGGDDPGELARFTAELEFELDGFQRRACAALENGHGVLVCAPTGAGKTVVGEFAVHLALVS